MEIIAHLYGNKVQTLQEHLQNIVVKSSIFAENCYLNKDHMKQIGVYHDIGKTSDEFQSYIRNDNNKKISHSNYGGFLLAEKDIIGSFCVFSHHTGLPDWGNAAQQNSTFLGRYQKVKAGDGLHYHMEKIELPEVKRFSPVKVRKNTKYPKFDIAMEIRMYLSCLVDADWQDSAEQFNTVNFDSWETIYNRFFGRTEKFFQKAENSSVNKKTQQINRWRTEIFNDCRNAGRYGTSSIYSLSAPTGAGKTFASMAFALERVKRESGHLEEWRKLKRIIYCIPYTSIIEQNAKAYEDMLGINNVVENHSLAEYAKKAEEALDVSEEEYRTWTIENWDAPIVLSTNVQFFESLLAYKTRRVRKLHNIANSVIILDEAQMLPRDFLLPCKEILKLLVEEYHCTVVLCTATQPALHIGEDNNEILSDAKIMYERFKRVSAEKLAEPLSEEELAGHIVNDIENGKSVLCVVNRRNLAQKLFKILDRQVGDNVYHLSLNMCAAHRELVFSEIRGKIGKVPICVVSTSLIEAGVDLSFDVGYRELAGLDRLVQAAGRVNRNGESNIGILKVFRFLSMKYEQLEQWVTGELLNDGIDVFSQEAIGKYFNSLYSRCTEKDFDKQDIMGLVDRWQLRQAGSIPMIADDSIPVLVPFKEADSLIKKLISGKLSKPEWRILRRYVVSIPRYCVDELLKYRALEMTEEGFYVLSSFSDWYDKDCGLKTKFESQAFQV